MMDLETERVEHLQETLAEIKNIDTSKCRSIMTDYDSFIEDFQQEIKLKSVKVSLKKAEKFYADAQELLEKSWLFNAYSTIKEANISNEDLRTATLVDYSTGNILTRERIEQRLIDLGWKG